ncbi:MAG: SpoIIE family protein phosphatase [Candidatus Omnitrophica bacterium]|nr:SpoIIE family protein phosphatase [Candidatus Omnitrophota bacterium]
MERSIIPSRFLPDYRIELSRVFRAKIDLYCYIVMAVFALELGAGLIFFRHILNRHDLPGILGAIVFSGLLLLTAPMAKTLRAQKGRAFLFSLLLILIAILAPVSQPEIMRYMGIGLVLLALFPGILLLPWNWMEASLIGLFAVVNFIWVYLVTGIYVNKEVFGINIIWLVLATVISAAIKRSEEVLRQKDFISRMEIAEKNAIMAKELDLAKKVHKSLVPHSIQAEPADVAVTYKPMFYMGGDYAKFQFIDKEKLIFVLADVTGHGVSAALLVNRMHTEIERLIREGLMPGELLKELEGFISREFGKTGMLLTAFCGLLDFADDRLVYSNHGHPPQILFQSSDKNIVLMRSQTFLMGIGLEAADIWHNDISFEKGDRIILFTDGIIEAKGPGEDLFGQERLEAFAKDNSELEPLDFNRKLVRELEDFRDGPQDDDIFLLTIQTKKKNTAG